MTSGISQSRHRVAVIVTTYNRPRALAWVLAALSKQTRPADQIVIADDGSGKETGDLIKVWREFYIAHRPQTQLLHAWQPDDGFRAARARNQAVDLARREGNPDVLVFLDGDCVAPKAFIKNHLTLLARGKMVAGGRGLLTQAFTQSLEKVPPLSSEGSIDEALRLFGAPYWLWLTRRCDRYFSMQSNLASLWNGLRDLRGLDDSLVRTCNLSLWRDDYDAVNGFNECFVGWGLEDTDLAVRLIKRGVRVRTGRFATNVFHLWHPERSREQLPQNAELLLESRQSQTI